MLEELYKQYDKLQRKYGDKKLNSIYFGGKKENPDLCFVFMNPTAGNIAAEKSWDGPRYPWLGTKNVWKLFYKVGLLDEEILEEISQKKKQDWTKEFCEKVYKNLEDHNVYITNLAKCTQVDARPLKDDVFKSYLKIFKKEIKMVNPKKIILLGNQVSSIVLEEKIKVSEVRKKEFIKDGFKFYSVYYPVGNGIFNMDKAVEDILYIKRKELNTTLLILKKDQKILLARKKRGFGFGKWNGIGGKQEKEESIDEAMLRETKEEIGITPVDYQKIGIINFTEYYKEELTNVHMHTYIATDWKGNIEESEEMFPKWFDVDQLPWEDMFEDMKYFLPYLLDKKKIIGFFEYDKNWNLIKHEIQEQNK